MHVLRRQTQTAHRPWKSEKISQSKTEILQKSTGTQKGTAKPRNWQAKPAVAGSLPASSGGGSGNWQAKPAVPGSPPASSSEGAGKSVVADRDCCEMGVQTDMQLLCQAHEPMVQANMTQQATYMWAPQRRMVNPHYIPSIHLSQSRRVHQSRRHPSRVEPFKIFRHCPSQAHRLSTFLLGNRP